MDKTIDGRFSRLEKALSALINSISTYNPVPHLATELVNADDELTEGLEQLSTHQSNHARILALRATSATLDEQIQSTLSLLTSTRAELLETPATDFPEDTNPVSYAELLSYARRISKFTIPPTFREAQLQVSQESKEQQDVITNGASTPIPTNGSLIDLNGLATGDATPVDAESKTALPAPIAEWLNPLVGGPLFVPWPTEETIRRGALASIQVLLDQGVDPATFDPERSAELEAERKRLEEENERLKEQQEAERVKVEEERRALQNQRRRESGGGMIQKPAVFTGLDLLDDMDEDDD